MEEIEMNTTTERSKEQAQAQIESIVEIVAALDGSDDDDAEEAIREDALSVQVRSGWHTPSEFAKAEEYEILLCTGGPAVRIIGELNDYQEPETCTVQHQDWFTPWTELVITKVEEEAVLKYARCFYFS